MSILNITTDLTGSQGVEPQLIYISTNDSFERITMDGYLNSARSLGFTFDDSDIAAISYLDSNNVAMSQFFRLSIVNNSITLIPIGSTVTTPSVADNLVAFSDVNGNIEDSGIAKSEVILTTSTTGQTVSVSTSSATPGTIRSLIGSMTETATTMSSGNLVGLRGVVNYIGASGGFLYGTQGKLIPTGTLSGAWNACLFGQFDLSAATITTGELAAVWADYGTTASAGTYAGARMYAGTNTTAAILNSQIYLYGGATNLLELVDNNGLVGPTYFVAAGTSAGSAGDTTKCNASKVLKITVNSTDYWVPLFASNS